MSVSWASLGQVKNMLQKVMESSTSRTKSRDEEILYGSDLESALKNAFVFKKKTELKRHWSQM